MEQSNLDKSIAFLIYVGVSVSAVIAITVIAVPIISPMVSNTYTIPAELKEWGGVIIGFYFGSFITLISNLLRARSGLPPLMAGAQPQAEPDPGHRPKPAVPLEEQVQ